MRAAWRPSTRLNHAKVKVFVASNQSGIARKLLDYEILNQIHGKMLSELARYGGHIDGIFICPHLKGECRKPNPGMLAEIEPAFRAVAETSAADRRFTA